MPNQTWDGDGASRQLARALKERDFPATGGGLLRSVSFERAQIRWGREKGASRERSRFAERGESAEHAECERRGRGCSHSRWDGAGGARGPGASRVASARGSRTKRRGRSRRG